MAETNNKPIYLDYAASAPVDSRLFDMIKKSSWANPNSLHTLGRTSRTELEDARRSIARSLGAARSSEIIFTSGASEALNTIIWGLLKPNSNYVVVSALEHPAMRKAVEVLKSRGIRVRVVMPNTQGIITPKALAQVLDDLEDIHAHVPFVAVQAVNSELGSIMPCKELARVAHKYNTLFVCDMVQALGKINFNLADMEVDLAVFSGHKIGVPTGIGALYIKAGVNCLPLIRGGGQEFGVRSGTPSVALASAFAQEVIFALKERKHTWDHLSFLQELLLAKLKQSKNKETLYPTLASQKDTVPHILSLYSTTCEAQTMLLRFDEAGICLSAGSACSSRSLDPSYVLTSIGVKPNQAHNTIRLSFGKHTTAAEIDAFLEAIPNVLAEDQ